MVEIRKKFDEDNKGKWWIQTVRARMAFDKEQHLFEKNCKIAEKELQKLD